MCGLRKNNCLSANSTIVMRTPSVSVLRRADLPMEMVQGILVALEANGGRGAVGFATASSLANPTFAVLRGGLPQVCRVPVVGPLIKSVCLRSYHCRVISEGVSCVQLGRQCNVEAFEQGQWCLNLHSRPPITEGPNVSQTTGTAAQSTGQPVAPTRRRILEIPPPPPPSSPPRPLRLTN